MLGAPNSGKGTCAQALAKKYDAFVITDEVYEHIL